MRLPYAAVEFTTRGDPADPGQVDAAVDLARRGGVRHVLLLAHGWNSDIPRAEALFSRLGDRVAAALGPRGREVAVVGVLWPAIRWADEDDIAGGGVSTADDRAALDAAIDASVEDPAVAAALRAAADRLAATGEGREEFVAALRALLPADALAADPEADEEGVPRALVEGDPDVLFDAAREARLAEGGEDLEAAAAAAPETAPGVAPDLLAATGTAGTTGTGFGLGSLLDGARTLLNMTTYYTMKARAGTVGSRGVADLARRVADGAPGVTVHLAGHSFGARVAAAAAAASTVPIGSLTLLQGAFSHYGFASDYRGSGKDGVFRPALTAGRLRGPVVVTHTANDRAVRTAYAVASRIARQTGAAFVGGRSDVYGGIGANGAVETAEAVDLELLPADRDYAFAAGRVHNLRADRFVSGHSAVTGPEVAHALASALTSAR